ncbi:unnamed protein product [Parascedosporium putredinis]|uniref:Enoyl-CoA hydratase n=1 Tax=Parascedosporium putredinis TaxID=1442378 RepID=A0A9P1GX71_9PEZI|nr:unnamed protein product [Parascedosporium putredinis]CAI7989557.1 unnamed protein product [Parascedosporium putredinis]
MSYPIPKLNGFSASFKNGVAILAYNRPESGNSLHPTVLKSYLDSMKWAVANPEVKVIVQTGIGKFFTTGRDMGGDGGEFDPQEVLNNFKELNEILITCPKVLIAAVNGPAAGYGTTSLALYDLVYAVQDAYFFTPFSKWALCPEGCSSRMSATELWTAGLVTKIIPAHSNAAFMGQVLEVAERIATYPPIALAASKKLMEGNRQAELLAANERECECLVERIAHSECSEALLGFAEEQKQKKSKKSRRGPSRI